MKYINRDFFLLTLGLVFSLPNSGEIFLQYIGPIVLGNAINSTIPLMVFIIWVIISFGAIFGFIGIIRKYYNMRGILNNKHGRNIFIGFILGVVIGIILDLVLF